MASDAAFSGSKIQIAFLGETKRTIPRSRPASGRASRAGLVQDAACGTGAQRRLVLDETEHGAMLVQVGGPPASSKTATPNHVLPVIPGDRNELVECHSEATRGRSPCRPIGQQIVLRRSVESALCLPGSAGRLPSRLRSSSEARSEKQPHPGAATVELLRRLQARTVRSGSVSGSQPEWDRGCVRL